MNKPSKSWAWSIPGSMISPYIENAICLDFVVDKCYQQGQVEEILVSDKAILL